MKFFKANVLSLVTLIAMVGVSFYLYPTLPEQLPFSFDIDGTVREYQSKEQAAILLPAIYALLLVAINLLIRFSPQKFSMPNSKHAMDVIMFGIGVFLFFIHLGLLSADDAGDTTRFHVNIGVGLFLIIVGNVFGKTERNFFIGLRTPWTLASIENWRATHRLTGKMAVGIGVVLLVLTNFYNHTLLTFVLAMSVIIVPLIYSFVYYWKYERPNESGDQDPE